MIPVGLKIKINSLVGVLIPKFMAEGYCTKVINQKKNKKECN
jgi:hypothetical protein